MDFSGTFRVSQVLDASLDTCHALRWTPADPRNAHQNAFSVLASGPLTPSPSAFWTVFTVTPNNGAVSSFRKCGLPCGLCRSLCTLQLCRSAFASSTTATLGMNGWLGLIHQGLPPWKKRQAKLGAPTVCVTGAGAGVDSVREQEKLEARKMLENAAESHTPTARFVSPPR